MYEVRSKNKPHNRTTINTALVNHLDRIANLAKRTGLEFSSFGYFTALLLKDQLMKKKKLRWLNLLPYDDDLVAVLFCLRYCTRILPPKMENVENSLRSMHRFIRHIWIDCFCLRRIYTAWILFFQDGRKSVSLRDGFVVF